MTDTRAPYILVLYYSRSGGTANLARHIARGVDQNQGDSKLDCARCRR